MAQPLGGRRRRREARRELVETARGDLVAGQPEQLVLAREVRVDRADRQAALADDVGDRRAVVALLAEDPAGGDEDPVPDLLLVGGADARHVGTPKRMFASSQSSARLVRDATHRALDKANDHSLWFATAPHAVPTRYPDVQPLGSVRLPLPPSHRPDRRRHRARRARSSRRQASSALSAGGWLDAELRIGRGRRPARRPSSGPGKSSVIALFRSTHAGRRRDVGRVPGAPSPTSIAGLADDPDVTGIVGYAETGDPRFISTAGDAAYIVIELDVTDEASVDARRPGPGRDRAAGRLHATS